jgi:hypothetical protein
MKLTYIGFILLWLIFPCMLSGKEIHYLIIMKIYSSGEGKRKILLSAETFPGPFNNRKISSIVMAKSVRAAWAKGRLQYDGTRYLKFAETGEIFLNAGTDAPKNFLSYEDFDGTFHDDGHKDNLVKSWEAHLKDWNDGNPTWKNGKGKAIISSVNYLAPKGLNSFSFMNMNSGGDDRNVFPYVDYDTDDRFDCSKLYHWEVIFEHADKLGMFLHFKLMEDENQGLLDKGAVGAYTKLYYRELMARFGHHLALNQNIEEDFGDWGGNKYIFPFNITQRLVAAENFHQHDTYGHHIVIYNSESFEGLLGPESKFAGVSVQTWNEDFSRVHEQALRWIGASKETGKQWAVAVDEPGEHRNSLAPDEIEPEHNDPASTVCGEHLGPAPGVPSGILVMNIRTRIYHVRIGVRAIYSGIIVNIFSTFSKGIIFRWLKRKITTTWFRKMIIAWRIPVKCTLCF